AFYVAEVQALYADDMTSIRAVATKQNTWSVGENADNGCRLYPNPASTMLRIETESPMQQVEVFDLLGRLVLRENPNANSACIDLSHCENGVYFIQILHENGAQQVQKVVKL
ncbi:MAG: T9SS type A sorting domain-containing protein, partial [Bacteroidales bacterium]|nr:T9SS type A sorting domain-containing protein [Bacteroidales bacterium]